MFYVKKQILKKMKIISKNTSSPFKLTRSIVPQNEGGSYQTGGYDPNSYDRSNEIYSSSIEGLGSIVGAALGSITKTDKYKMDLSKEKRQTKRVEKLEQKSNQEGLSENKKKRIENRKTRVQGRLKDTEGRIKEYESVYGKLGTSNDFLRKEREK
jgi:hypothetical protein